MQFSLVAAAVAAVAFSSAASAEEERMVSIRTSGAGVLVRGGSSLNAQTCYGAPKAPWVKGHYPGWICGNKPNKGNFCGKPWSSYPSWGNGDLDFCDWPFAKYWPICKKWNGGGGSTSTFTTVKSVTSTVTATQVIPTTTTVNGSPVTTTTTATVTSTVTAPGSTPTGCVNGYSTTFQNYTTVALTGVYQGQTVGAATIDIPHYLTYGLVDTVQDCFGVCNSIAACTFVNVYREFNSTIKDSYGQGKLTCAAFSACSGTDAATNYGGQDDPTYVTESNGYCKCSGGSTCN